MGVAYFLQFLDKLVLSQATLFNLRQDLVAYFPGRDCDPATDCDRTCTAISTLGPPRSSTSVTWHGVSRVPT